MMTELNLYALFDGILQISSYIVRSFMVIKGNGLMLTMRDKPRMTLIKPSIKDGMLHLDAPGMETLKVPSHLDRSGRQLHKVE